MLVNVIGISAVAFAVAGAIMYLLRQRRIAKKNGGHACIGCHCNCGCNGCNGSAISEK